MKAQRFLVLALGATLSSSAAATAQTSPTGRTITELRAGDYVWPKFSPSGRLLAVSQVLADSAGENTQILILDMRRGVLDTLLSAKAAAKYATYKAYVRDFQWLSDTSLLAWIPDGDVGVTAVTFNVRTRPSPSMCVPEASCTRSTTREVKTTRMSPWLTVSLISTRRSPLPA